MGLFEIVMYLSVIFVILAPIAMIIFEELEKRKKVEL